MKTHEEILNSLKEQFENHRVPISEYESQILPQVETVKWATEPQFHLMLLKIERSRISKGRVYKEERTGTTIKLGYDNQNRTIYEEGRGQYKKFIFYKEDSVWLYEFSNDKIKKIEYQTIEQSYPATYASYAQGVVNTVDKYVFEDKQLVEIDSYNSYEAFGHSPQMPNYFITYNQLGDISEIRRVDESSDFRPKGQDVAIYKRHGYSIKALRGILISELKKSITHELQQHDFDGQTLLLIFISNAFGSDGWLPPRFSIVKPMDNGHFDKTIYELIKIDAVVSEHPVSNKLEEAARLLEQEVELQEKYRMPQKILVKAAKEIKLWWSENSSDKGNEELVIFPLESPDDNYLDVSTILKRLYSSREIKTIKKAIE